MQAGVDYVGAGSSTQTVISLSSGESEFYAAVRACLPNDRIGISADRRGIQHGSTVDDGQQRSKAAKCRSIGTQEINLHTQFQT